MNLNPLNMLVTLLRPLLYPFSILYGIIMWLRNKLYDSGIYSSITFSVPVINVGNLSTGGTGKTPHIEYLIRLLQYEYKVATMSRGYKRRSKGFILAGTSSTAFELGDEPMQFHLKYPEVAVSVAEERMTGIPALISEKPFTEVVLLDDAYQHRSVKAGLNILITDYAKPFYTDFILPFGNLRESRSAYKRANIIIVSKCPAQLGQKEQQKIIESIAPLPHQQVFFTKIKYGTCYDIFTGASLLLTPQHKVILISGIAKPEPMLNYLKTKVAEVHLLRYADHHYYTDNNLEEIKQTFDNWPSANTVLVTTEKDATRLSLKKEKLQEWDLPLFVLTIEIGFLNDGGKFDKSVIQYIERERAEERDSEQEEFEELF